MPAACGCAERRKSRRRSRRCARERSTILKTGCAVSLRLRPNKHRYDFKICYTMGMTAHREELAGRWSSSAVLKRDLFSTIERGRFRTEDGEVDAVLRHLDDVPWWARLLANELFRRECRALGRARPLSIAPPLL